MASVGESTHTKRPHVKTERMQEFIRSQEEAGSPHKKLKCHNEWCNKVFTSAPGLKYHMQTHIMKNPQFTCSKCHKVFKSANGLKYHKDKAKCEDTDYTLQLPDFLKHEDSGGESMRRLSRLVPEALDLSNVTGDRGVGVDKLTELAIFATGPQSPLMQKHKPLWADSHSSAVGSLGQMGTSPDPGVGGCPPATPTDGFSIDRLGCVGSLHDGSDPRVSTSSPLPTSPGPDDPLTHGGTWSHTWPTIVWQCFIKGSRIRLLDGRRDWELAEYVGQKAALKEKALISEHPEHLSYAHNGLCIKAIKSSSENMTESEIEIAFSPRIVGQSDLLAVCQHDHPFFVKDKGWSSYSPSETVEHYGIPCSEVGVGDVCLPPTHKEATFSEEIFKSFEEFDFTPEDTSAVFTLSSMKQWKDCDVCPVPHSPKKIPVSKPDSPAKSKRPMNAFMLFAKEFRLGLTQQFPSRSNRSISVMLGEKWKALSESERLVYEQRARKLAAEQKRIHPDCWKRKK